MWSLDHVPPDTRDRILDGATDAIARHGLAKLDMRDVSVASGVSRGTLYRYFPSRHALLVELAAREGLRFKQEMLDAIETAPPGAARLHVALQHAVRRVREHPVLQRLVETDPAFVLRALRAQFPALEADFHHLLAPLLADLELVRQGTVDADQLVDWVMRLMVSVFLLPPSRPDEMIEGLTAVYRMLVAPATPRS
jgi:AcrR family transcriptional regulator